MRFFVRQYALYVYLNYVKEVVVINVDIDCCNNFLCVSFFDLIFNHPIVLGLLL